MSPESLPELLQRFRSKARCYHTQRAAESAWHRLRALLSEDERFHLQLAWEHWRLGEGPDELDDVVDKLIAAHT